jgi:uncharacterized membrane protein
VVSAGSARDLSGVARYEPTNPESDESESRPRRPRPRIHALSDLVFGLALSLGTFPLLAAQPKDAATLTFGLFWFGFGFLILVNVWYRYSWVMSVLPADTSGILSLNLLLLFLVALEPYLLSQFVLIPSFQGISETASVYYALDLAGMNLILATLMRELVRGGKLLVPRDLVRHTRFVMAFQFALAGLFLVTALPVFWTWHFIDEVPSRVVLWILIPVFRFLLPLLERWTDPRSGA